MSKQMLLVGALGAAFAAGSSVAMAQGSGKKGVEPLSSTCAANAPVREFLLTTGEIDTVPRDRERKPAAYRDRGHARNADSKLERYTFEPGMIAVRKGDCVVLKIHALKGSHHNMTIEGTAISSAGAQLIDDMGAPVGAKAVRRESPNAAFAEPKALKDGEFARGEQVLVRFQANQPGTYRMICETHTFVGAKGQLMGYDDKGKPVQGPMVGYLLVL
jgi:plastocyanin